MRSFATSRQRFHAAMWLFPLLIQASITANHAFAQASVVAQSRPVSSGVVCPKCGRVHASSTTVTSANPVITQAATPVTRGVAPVAYQSVTGGGAQNVLGTLNGQRSRQGLRSLRYDPTLQAVAERRARQMASMGIKSHPPGSFSPGRYEGVGWSSSYSPNGVYACYTSDPNMTVAGAAMVSGRDGVYFAVVYR